MNKRVTQLGLLLLQLDGSYYPIRGLPPGKACIQAKWLILIRFRPDFIPVSIVLSD